MKGLIHVYMGEGKGKTTATVGLAIRAAGRGKKVVYLQFLKGPESGEINIMNKIDNICFIGNKEKFDFVWKLSKEEKQSLTDIQNANFALALEKVEKEQIDMLVIDELFSACNTNTIDVDKVKAFILNKPEQLEVVMSGHEPEPFFIELADYVTNMEKIKHPYDIGIAARIGIEM